MDISGKNVLVIGSGISGIGSCSLLSDYNANVFLYDGNEALDKEEIKNRFSKGCQVKEIILGNLSSDKIDEIDLTVISPGVWPACELVQKIMSKNIPVIGEIELAYLLGKGTVIGITGTNGKTTTTALTGKIMKEYAESVYIVGNIGIPYTTVAGETQDNSVIVAEISSFQLETTKEFRPHVAAILNVTPDHLDRHLTMENYIDAKLAITKAQTAEDICVLNYDSEITRSMKDKIKSKPFFFSRLEQLKEGVCLQEEDIVYCHDGVSEKICNISELLIPGEKNVENAMAAAAMAISMNVPLKNIHDSMISFHAVEHRIEYVAEKNGVKYYNDSKGTNVDAAITGINAMTRPTVLLGGGYDKKIEFDEWIKSCVGKVKCLVLIGATKEQIAKTAEKYKVGPVLLAETFEEAMILCEENAESGDAVLLSPACASWGMFKNYEQRGNMFKEYVNNIKS